MTRMLTHLLTVPDDVMENAVCARDAGHGGAMTNAVYAEVLLQRLLELLQCGH
jgi:hypothetical protein